MFWLSLDLSDHGVLADFAFCFCLMVNVSMTDEQLELRDTLSKLADL